MFFENNRPANRNTFFTHWWGRIERQIYRNVLNMVGLLFVVVSFNMGFKFTGCSGVFEVRGWRQYLSLRTEV